MSSEEVINDNYLKCPHCGFEDDCSFELKDEEEKHQCPSCEKWLSYTSYFVRTFTAKKLKEEEI